MEAVTGLHFHNSADFGASRISVCHYHSLHPDPLLFGVITPERAPSVHAFSLEKAD